MRRNLTRIICFLIALSMLATGLTMALPPRAARAAVIDRVVARIDNEIVTLHELRQALTPYVLQNGMNPAVLEDRNRRAELMRAALEDLVDRRLMMAEAKKLELRISDEEVDQWLAYTRQQQGLSESDFRMMLAQQGLEYDAYREIVRENLLRIRLINVRVGAQATVSEAEVDAELRRRFGNQAATETFVTLSHILVRPTSDSAADRREARERAEQLRARLEAGEDFAALAEEAGGSNGGALGTFGRGELEASFERAAFAVEKGEYSPVVETPFGYHIITVTEREERASEAMTERRAQVQAELQQKAMERQLEIFLQGLRSRSFVEVKL